MYSTRRMETTAEGDNRRAIATVKLMVPHCCCERHMVKSPGPNASSLTSRNQAEAQLHSARVRRP